MDWTHGLRNTGSCGRAVAGLRIVWNAIIDPPVPGGSAQAAHRHCTRPFPGESGLATRDYRGAFQATSNIYVFSFDAIQT